MNNTRNITGIVLSGGQSSRMGTEKGRILLLDKPLVEYALDVLKNICNKILISANDNAYQSYGYPVVHDGIRGVGPAGGILSALKASRTEINFVLSCDMPLVSEKLVEWLLDIPGTYDIVIPRYHGFAEPLCGCYRKSVIPVLEKLLGEGVHKMQDIFKELNTLQVDTRPEHNFYGPDMFLNLNTPADVRKAEKLLQNRKR